MTDSGRGAAWYALRSKPNKERMLWKQILARDIEVYYPRIRVQRVDPRSRKIRPYFPGYLFVLADLKEMGASTFNYMPYSIGLVSFGGRAAPIKSEVIEHLRQHIGDFVQTEHSNPDRFKRGDRVEITGGPLEGYEAIFDHRLSGTQRVRVLLNLLNRPDLPAQLDSRYLEPSKKGKQIS